jgi:hypothetical protein
MCEYLKFKIENWILYVKHLEFEILKIEMSKFGYVNIEMSENWNLKSLCEIEMPKYWKLKCLNIEN